MSLDVTVVIPVERGQEWNQERALHLPDGTPYLIAEHDPGEWVSAVNESMDRVGTTHAILSAPDVWWERQPEAIEFLVDLCWNVDLTWGPQVLHRGDTGYMLYEGAFCPNRLSREPYVNPACCFRKESFQKVGGVKTGMWEFHDRLARAGNLKYVPEALSARDGDWIDPSDAPVPNDVIATFYHQATPGTTYWRCLLPARFMPAQVCFNLPTMIQIQDQIELLNHEGTAILQYGGDLTHHLLTEKLMELGIKVLIEVDDDYTRWHKDVMTKAKWAEHMGEGYSVEGHRATCEIADGITVTTERLAKMYRPLNKNVYICPNQIDPADWPDPVKPDDGIFRIGWFASASHRRDEAQIVRAMEWASRQPGVEVVLIGLGLHKSGKPWYKFPFRHYPWSNDLGVYKQFLPQLDVGLAPVVPTPWAVCRSDLKALEYAMAQALPIVADVPPYDTLGDMPGVMHCKDPKAFLRAVQWTVANKDEARQLAKKAREYVLAERTVEANIDRWREAVA